MCKQDQDKVGKLEILYKGEYYDVTEWIQNHPGGDIINLYTEKGEDATLAILQFHYRSQDQVSNILSSLKKRKATENDVVLSAESQVRHDAITEDYLEIIKDAESKRLFDADWGYTLGRISETFFYYLLILWGIYPETPRGPFPHVTFLKTIFLAIGLSSSGILEFKNRQVKETEDFKLLGVFFWIMMNFYDNNFISTYIRPIFFIILFVRCGYLNFKIKRRTENLAYLGLFLGLTYFENFFLSSFLRTIWFLLLFIRSGFLQHEFGHKSLSGNGIFDKFWQNFYMNGILGFSSSWWNEHHNRHHAMPQRLHQDGDLNTLPLLAFNSKVLETSDKSNNFFIKNQDKLFPLNIILATIYLRFIKCPKHILENGQFMEMIFFGLHHYWVYSCLSNDIINIPMYLILFCIPPIYLYGTVCLNHTHIHMPLSDKSEGSKHWVEYCIENCSNINGNGNGWITWFTGYSNYHIEHHLFPQIPAVNYAKIQNRIKKLAQKYDIPYVSHGYTDLFKMTIKNLKNVTKSMDQ